MLKSDIINLIECSFLIFKNFSSRKVEFSTPRHPILL